MKILALLIVLVLIMGVCYLVSVWIAKAVESYRDRNFDPVDFIEEFTRNLPKKLPSVRNHFWDIEIYSVPDGDTPEPRMQIQLVRTIDEAHVGEALAFSLKYGGESFELAEDKIKKISFLDDRDRTIKVIKNSEEAILKWATDLSRDVRLGSLEERKDIAI